MNGAQALGTAFGFNHRMAKSIIGDMGLELINQKVAGSTINQAGTIFAHAVLSEDMFIQAIAKGGPTLRVSGGWDAKWGMAIPERPVQTVEWDAAMTLNLETFMPYVDAVFSATETFFAALSDAELDREVQAMGRAQPLGELLATLGVFHMGEHLGEIAALKGVMGVKGLPF